MTGRKRRYPDVKIILAHLGGSTPFLASRVAVLSRYMGCELTPEEILDDFRSFYYDTALSAWGPNLTAMDSFVSPTQILFGTDFPGEYSFPARRSPSRASLHSWPRITGVVFWLLRSCSFIYSCQHGDVELVHSSG